MNELSGAFDTMTPLRGQMPVRRRKRSPVAALLAGALLRAIVVVGMPVALVVWLLYSPYFRITSVDVQGGSRVSSAWMEENLQPLVGRHVLAVSLGGVQRRLSAHPWVASVELRRELPDRLRVAVVERQPVALLEGAQTPAEPASNRKAALVARTFLDAAGAAIAPCPPQGGEGLLLIRYPFPGPVPVQAALDVVAELRRAEPPWGIGVERVEVLGENEYRVETRALAFPLLVKSGEIAEAVDNLQRVLPDIGQRWPQVAEVDLRQPRRLVVRPQEGALAPSQKSRSNSEG